MPRAVRFSMPAQPVAPLAHAASEALALQASTDLAQLMARLLNAGAFCSAQPGANQAITPAMNQEPA